MPNKDYINDKTNLKAFSGCDMTVHIAGKQCGTLQAITISITRETLPIYVLGNPDMRAVVRGKRGIAGTLVFTNFNKHALLRQQFADDSGRNGLYGQSFGALSKVNELLKADSQYVNTNGLLGMNTHFMDGAPIDIAGASLRKEVAEVYDMVRSRIVQYSDQIPEFDICITMVNEDGDASWATINGVTIINEGFGYTMDDLSSESAYTFIAKSVTPLTAIAGTSNSVGPAY